MAVITERIPFAEAISDKLLLKDRFDSLSLPQQVALKVFYGLPLSPPELRVWSMFQEGAVYDALGYPTSIDLLPYTPKEYEQAWLIWGRRGSKTDSFTATIFAYEAVLGGHMQYARKGQEVIMLLVADKLVTAKSHLSFVVTAIQSSPILSSQLVTTNADALLFKNGMKIIPAPPSVKLARGLAVPVVAMDEVGFWYKDAESANPDYEVERAVAYAQAQFPHRKRLGTSTPWTKEGLLWKYHNAGTEGVKCPQGTNVVEFKDILVLHAPTAALENPLIKKEFLEKERSRDSDAFEREALARFVDSISGFLSTSLLREAVDKGVRSRQPLPRPGVASDPSPTYVAAIDPAFRRDYFAFTIVHNDPIKGIVQDVAMRLKGLAGKPLNPSDALDTITPVLKQYRVGVVYSDQYQLEALNQLAVQRGWSISGVDFTARSKAKILGNLQQLVNQNRLRLLDNEETLMELIGLEKRLTATGAIQVAAPQGRHDDMAMVLALAVHQAIWTLPTVAVDAEDAPKTIVQLGLEQIERQREDVQQWEWD